MKVKLHHLALSLTLGFMMNTALAQTAPVQSFAQTQITTKTFEAQPFHSIELTGPISVQIKAGQSKYSLSLISDPDSLRNVYAAVKNGVLYLGLLPNTPPPNGQILAKVTMSQLNQIRSAGTGNVAGENLTGLLAVAAGGTGTMLLVGKKVDLQDLRVNGEANVHIIGIESNLLNVQDDSKGKVNLGGNMVLHNLVYNGTGPLSIQWVNSSHVKVIGNGNGRVFLAGIADVLEATLSGRNWLDAKYLRAERGFISTRDYARADVWTRDTLAALATEKSNILYYNDSKMVGGYTNPPGNVLRMEGLKPLNQS